MIPLECNYEQGGWLDGYNYDAHLCKNRKLSNFKYEQEPNLSWFCRIVIVEISRNCYLETSFWDVRCTVYTEYISAYTWFV